MTKPPQRYMIVGGSDEHRTRLLAHYIYDTVVSGRSAPQKMLILSNCEVAKTALRKHFRAVRGRHPGLFFSGHSGTFEDVAERMYKSWTGCRELRIMTPTERDLKITELLLKVAMDEGRSVVDHEAEKCVQYIKREQREGRRPGHPQARKPHFATWQTVYHQYVTEKGAQMEKEEVIWETLRQLDVEAKRLDKFTCYFTDIIVDQVHLTTPTNERFLRRFVGLHTRVVLTGELAAGGFYRDRTQEISDSLQCRVITTDLAPPQSFWSILDQDHDRRNSPTYEEYWPLTPTREQAPEPVVKVSQPTVSLNIATDLKDESATVARLIEGLEDKSALYAEGIVYPDEWHSEHIQLALLQSRIPFSVTGEPDFWDDTHIRTLLSYIYVALGYTSATDEKTLARVHWTTRRHESEPLSNGKPRSFDQLIARIGDICRDRALSLTSVIRLVMRLCGLAASCDHETLRAFEHRVQLFQHALDTFRDDQLVIEYWLRFADDYYSMDACSPSGSANHVRLMSVDDRATDQPMFRHLYVVGFNDSRVELSETDRPAVESLLSRATDKVLLFSTIGFGPFWRFLQVKFETLSNEQEIITSSQPSPGPEPYIALPSPERYGSDLPPPEGAVVESLQPLPPPAKGRRKRSRGSGGAGNAAGGGVSVVGGGASSRPPPARSKVPKVEA